MSLVVRTVGAPGIEWVEAKDAVPKPEVPRTVPYRERWGFTVSAGPGVIKPALNGAGMNKFNNLPPQWFPA